MAPHLKPNHHPHKNRKKSSTATSPLVYSPFYFHSNLIILRVANGPTKINHNGGPNTHLLSNSPPSNWLQYPSVNYRSLPSSPQDHFSFIVPCRSLPCLSYEFSLSHCPFLFLIFCYFLVRVQSLRLFHYFVPMIVLSFRPSYRSIPSLSSHRSPPSSSLDLSLRSIKILWINLTFRLILYS